MVIICDPIGGLGNQLFQIANVISIALDNKADWVIHKRKIIPMYAFGHRDVYWNNLFKNINAITIDLKKGYKYIEPKFSYQKIIPNIYTPRTVLCGYFQSYKYFEHNKDKVLDLLINKEIIHESQLILDNIKHELKQKNINKEFEYVSVHVRRGDYLKFPKVHHVLDISYYKETIDKFNKNNTFFLIFSDDIDWCKNNITPICPYNILVKNKDYNDLLLMSLCDHNIIANSSFSWWGAYLNSNINKQVYYPKKWFNEEGAQDTQDLCPSKWIEIV